MHERDEDITAEVPVFEDVTRTDVMHAVDAAGIAASCQQEALRAVAALEASFKRQVRPLLVALGQHTAASLMTPVRDALALIEAALSVHQARCIAAPWPNAAAAERRAMA